MKFFASIIVLVVAILIVVFLPQIKSSVVPEQVLNTPEASETTPTETAAPAAETSADLVFTDGVYVLNTEDSRVDWQGYGVGKSHFGRIENVEGMFTVAGDDLGADITLDMTSMVVDDLSGAGAQRLVDHLSNEDFFDITTYPEATFVTTDIVMQGDTAMVTADLTIKDVTQSVSFPMTMGTDGELVTGNASISLDRTDWGITFNSGSFFQELGEHLIKDEFDVTLAVIFERADE